MSALTPGRTVFHAMMDQTQTASPPVVIISASKNGVLNQCLALCERLQWPVGEIRQIAGGSPLDGAWAKMMKQLSRKFATARLSPKKKTSPAVRIVASGASSEALVAAYRNLYGDDLFAVFIGAPKWKKPIYDLAIASNHEIISGKSDFPSARNTIWMSGVFARKFQARNPDPKEPTLAVLIGGINRAFKFDARALGNQVEAALVNNSTSGLKTTIIFSRRTPIEIEQELRSRFQDGNVKLVDRTNRTGFEEAMENAAQYLVTPDSITMICEACSSNLPVTIFDLECINPNTSTARFIDEFVENQRINRFGDLGKLQKLEPLSDANARITASASDFYNQWRTRVLP